jgi:predicted secreted Zn-dependent protease
MKTKFTIFIIAIFAFGLSGIYMYEKNTDKTPPPDLNEGIIPEEIVIEKDEANDTEIISASPKESDKKTPVFSLPATSSKQPTYTPPKIEAPSPILCKKAVAVVASPLNTGTLKEGFTTAVDESYYSVYGSNSDHIYKELLACAPEGTTGAKEVGNASYKINISYNWRAENNRCGLNNIKVGLHIVYTMPKWEKGSSPSSDAIARWERFISGLWMHERTHGQHAKEGAEKILSYLQNFTDNGDCSNVGQIVQSKFESIEKEIRDKDAIFDSNPDNRVRW